MKSAEKTEKLSRIASMLRLAGDPTRLRILCVIFRRRNACVSEIADELGMSVAAVSHHLNLCARAGFLVQARKGKTVCYSLSGDRMTSDVRDFICKYT